MVRTKRENNQPSTSRAAAASRRRQLSSDESEGEPINLSNGGETTTVVIPILVTNYVKYILNHSTNKHAIKKADLTKALNISQKDYKQVYEGAEEILKEIYGLKIVEVPESKSGKQYMICSSMPNISFLPLSTDQRRDASLLFVILSYIFMKGGEVQEPHLIQFLMQIPLEYRTADIEDFIKKLIKDTLTRQLYIKRTKVEIEGKPEPEFYLTWGPRADLEYDKKTILANVSKIMQKSPLSFIAQYSQLHGDANINDTVMLE